MRSCPEQAWDVLHAPFRTQATPAEQAPPAAHCEPLQPFSDYYCVHMRSCPEQAWDV
eukprot:CAMPEP_0170606368 /NCGR_PEP_ID=MMETSP0224-20130122/20477_1 /TAXON_ID=285029 /ORGANISM="Togula jolla, Strain CCCM 725" /LENGTH=56 /DNA_ID=CAMNT_0010931449 /DNA_START=1 /DNA_END=168 /DNA_ORIENTATION=-